MGNQLLLRQQAAFPNPLVLNRFPFVTPFFEFFV
jgi:hypothetical protein